MERTCRELRPGVRLHMPEGALEVHLDSLRGTGCGLLLAADDVERAMIALASALVKRHQLERVVSLSCRMTLPVEVLPDDEGSGESER